MSENIQVGQRPIKFRAWHEGHGKRMPARMAYDERPGDSLRWLAEGQPVVVMQYTGLKDKNGKEIYEGDICERDEKHLNARVEVIFQEGAFRVKWHGEEGEGGGSDPIDLFRDIRVIGNIWEHPSLIKDV